MRRRQFAKANLTGRALHSAVLAFACAHALVGCGQFRPMRRAQAARSESSERAATSEQSDARESKVQKAEHLSPSQGPMRDRSERERKTADRERASTVADETQPAALPPSVDAASREGLEPSSPRAEVAGDEPTVPSNSLPFPSSPEATPPGVIESFVPANLKDPAANLAKARAIVDRSARFCDSTPKYTCRITRHERVNGKLLPKEILAMNFRLKPRSVYYKWLDKGNEGRELVYVDGANDGKIITLGGKADFLMTGKRVKVDPSGFLAKRNGRYSIKDSGIDAMMSRLTRQLANQAKGDFSHGRIEYIGTVRRKENHDPMDYLVHHTPPGADPAFPDGGLRHWFFDQPSGRLVLLHSDDLKQNFLEYYLFDRFLRNDALDDDSFNPDVLWPRHLKTADAKDTDLPK